MVWCSCPKRVLRFTQFQNGSKVDSQLKFGVAKCFYCWEERALTSPKYPPAELAVGEGDTMVGGGGENRAHIIFVESNLEEMVKNLLNFFCIIFRINITF